jgi:hypothetical protein
MSPLDQCLTLRLVRRQISIIDSTGFVELSVRHPPVDPEALQRERLLEALPERSGGARVRALQLVGQHAEAVERGGVTGEFPGRPEAALDGGAVALGQVLEHVSLLVADAALDGHREACPPRRRRAVQEHQRLAALVQLLLELPQPVLPQAGGARPALAPHHTAPRCSATLRCRSMVSARIAGDRFSTR